MTSIGKKTEVVNAYLIKNSKGKKSFKKVWMCVCVCVCGGGGSLSQPVGRTGRSSMAGV